MDQLEIIRALREACMAALPLVKHYVGKDTPRVQREARAQELIEHALSLGEHTQPEPFTMDLFWEELGLY